MGICHDKGWTLEQWYRLSADERALWRLWSEDHARRQEEMYEATRDEAEMSRNGRG